jgi:hypothetical protein
MRVECKYGIEVQPPGTVARAVARLGGWSTATAVDVVNGVVAPTRTLSCAPQGVSSRSLVCETLDLSCVHIAHPLPAWSTVDHMTAVGRHGGWNYVEVPGLHTSDLGDR